MSLKFCKKCGTLYEDKNGECPKCSTQPILDQMLHNAYQQGGEEMPPDEVKKQRVRSWIQLVIGVPLFIGFIYLIFYLMKVIKG